MGPQDEGFSSALAVSGMMTPTDKSGKLWCKPEVVQMREDDASEEQSQNEDDRRSVFDRAKGVIGSARRQVSRSVDVVTGEDIRRFDEFTDATTGPSSAYIKTYRSCGKSLVARIARWMTSMSARSI